MENRNPEPQPKTLFDTREAWLHAAADLLWSDVLAPVLGEGKEKPKWTISVGFPFRSSKAIGQCWDPAVASDEASAIFISPKLHEVDSEQGVLATLLHEMIHAAVGVECGHRGAFRRTALAAGLEGKMTATVAGDDLIGTFKTLSEKLKAYPHGALNPGMRRKKQATRLLKVACGDCGYTIRVTQKWVDVGLPTCACGNEMDVA